MWSNAVWSVFLIESQKKKRQRENREIREWKTVLLNTAGVQTPSLSGFPLFNNKFLMHFSEKGRLKLLKHVALFTWWKREHCPKISGGIDTTNTWRFFFYFTNIRVIRKTKICLYINSYFFQPDYDPTSVKDGCKRNFCLRFCLFHHRCLWQTSKPGNYDNYVT